MKHTAKTLKRLLKKAGLKCSGKKATLRARATKAKLVRGGGGSVPPANFASGASSYPSDGGVGSGAPAQAPVKTGGRRRRHRRRGGRDSSASSSSSSDSD